jgi:hypothetical protein
MPVKGQLLLFWRTPVHLGFPDSRGTPIIPIAPVSLPRRTLHRPLIQRIINPVFTEQQLLNKVEPGGDDSSVSEIHPECDSLIRA